MTNDLMPWILPFSKSSFPQWRCSSCGLGILELQDKTLNKLESADSLSGKKDEAWDPEWITERFVAILKCNNKKCKESACITGHITPRQYFYEGGIDFDDTFYIEYIDPPPRFFKIPDKCPKDLKREIVRSLRLLFIDPSASANAARSCVELILNHLNVKKTYTRNGKRTKSTLHKRIKNYQQKNNEIGEFLMALKWLGNAGSHPEAVTKKNMLDAFGILDYVLGEIFLKKTQKIKKLTKKIIKKKGPLTQVPF